MLHCIRNGRRAFFLLITAGAAVFAAPAAQDPWTTEFTAATHSLRQKDYTAADEKFRKALSLAEAAGAAQQDRVITCLNSLGIVSNALGKTEEAESFYERAVRAADAKYGRQHPNTASLLLNLGIAYAANRKLADAEQALDRAWQNSDRNADLRAALILYHRGNLRRQRRRFRDAENDLTRSLFIRERQSRDLSEVGRTVFALGLLYKDSGRGQLEESMWRRYLEFRQMSVSGWDKDNVAALRNYAAVLRRNGKAELAAGADKLADTGARTLGGGAR